MKDRETKTIGSVIIGKRWVNGQETPVENLLLEYWNSYSGRLEWCVIYGACAGTASGSQRFKSREKAMKVLEAFRSLAGK